MARLALPIVTGLAGALVAVAVAGLKLKFLVAFALLIPMLVVAILLRSSARVEQLLVILLALTIPLNLDVAFFFRYHLGGAPAVSVGASMLCVLGLLMLWLYRYRIGAVRPLLVTQRSMVWASLIYMAVGILSLWNAHYRDLVALQEIRLAVLFVTMLVVMNLRRPELLRTFVFFLTVATFIQGALATAQFLTHSTLGMHIFGASNLIKLDIGVEETRPMGTTGHPNVLGYYLESTLPLSLALLLCERRPLLRLWYLTAFVATLAGLTATLSRGAWLSVPVSCGFTLWVLFRKRVFRLSSGVGISLIGAAMAVALYIAFPTIERRFFHDDYQSAATRWPLDVAAISVIRQFPILGVGLNNFGEVFRDYDTTGYARMLMKEVVTPLGVEYLPYKQVVHNLILWVWGEVGIAGLVAFLWVFGSAFVVAWKAYGRGDEWSRAVLVACAAGMLGHFVHAQLDPGFRVSPSVSMLFYSMFGLIGAISLHQRRELSREAPNARSRPERDVN